MRRSSRFDKYGVRGLFIAAALFAGAQVYGAQEEAAPQMATVAPFADSPSIDGTLAEGEWDGSLRVPGLMNYEDGFLVPYEMGVRFGYDRENIYIAIVSELPPDGTLVAQQTRRGANPQQLVFDDGVEIYIDPNRENRAAGRGERSFFHYHGNSVGAYTTIEYGPSGAPDPGWSADVEVANAIHEDRGVWVKELRFPLSAMRVKPDEVLGRDFGVLIARNIKRGRGWLQAPWFPHGKAAFVTSERYPRIRLEQGVPTVALESFGGLDVHKGPIDLKARVFNPGPARKAKVQLDIESTTMPELSDVKELDLPANGHAEYTFSVNEGRLHEHAKHKLDLRVTSPDGDNTYLNYTMRWKQAPDNRWPGVPIGPQPQRAFSTAYYPSHDYLRIALRPKWLELEECRGARYRILTSRGVVLYDKTVSWKGASTNIELTVPDLLDDVYTVEVTFDGWEEPITKTFERKHFPWEGNEIGITDEVLPPFEPIRVDGRTVDVVLRSYEVNGLGFWDSIKAAGNVSAGGPRELLTAPMQLVADGNQPLDGDGEFTKKADHEVVYEGMATHPAVVVQTRTTTEVDGCTRFELTLEPGTGNQELRTLALDIPLVDDLMPLFHVSSTSLRLNPAGATPEGDGRFWDTRDYPDGSWYGNFKPYIWLGAEERGLAWFADNDEGWVLNVDEEDAAKSTPCVELIRKDGTLTLRVNLVQKPITLTEPRTIVFGLMASPGKPMPKDWRTKPLAWMGSQYWGSDRRFAARYPRGGDLSPLDMMAAARLGRTFDFNTFREQWTERHWGEGSRKIEKPKEQMRTLLQVSRDMARRSRGRPFTVYWEEFHTVDHSHPAAQVFAHEWGGGSAHNIRAIAPSYRDFAVYWGAEFVRRGLGLYFDNSFPNQAVDPLISSAYRLPNGQIQPSAGIWARRAYLRRIWTVHEQWGDPRMPPLMMIHMTNTHILPYMVWNHANLDLEWFYGDTPAQQAYATDMLRAQSIGRQTGNIPTALARGHKSNERPNRRELGAIHEIRLTNNYTPYPALVEFGYGKDGTEVHNYWDEGYPVTFSDPQVKSITLVRDGKARVLLATWNGEPATVTMKPHAAQLGFEVSKVTDVRAKQALDTTNDGSVTLQLEGYGTRLLDLE